MKKIIATLFALLSISFFITSCDKDEEYTNPTIATEESNKQLVLKFYQRLFGDKDISAIDDYIVADYIQHNPQVADGRDAIKTMAAQWIAGTPKTTVDFRKAISEGNIVTLHVKSPTPNGSYQAITEFFRVENNKIVEHWDVIQDAPATSANSHPMFEDNPTVIAPRNLVLEENNKQLVRTFYQRLFGNKDLSAIDDYVVENYIQHNPQIADGRDALKAVAAQWLAGTPQSTVDFRKVMANGNLVVLHVKSPTPNGSYQAISEYFRVENNKIVEHWDVIQDAPATSANPHPMF